MDFSDSVFSYVGEIWLSDDAATNLYGSSAVVEQLDIKDKPIIVILLF